MEEPDTIPETKLQNEESNSVNPIDNAENNTIFVENKENGNTEERQPGQPILPIPQPVSQGEHGTVTERTGRTEEIISERKRRSEETLRDAPKDTKELSGGQQTESTAGETGLDNSGRVEGEPEHSPLGTGLQRESILRTAKAGDTAGSSRAILTAEEREELESRGINPDWDQQQFRKELQKAAEKNGVLLDQTYLSDKTLLHDKKAMGTSENDVYLSSDGRTVTKVNDLSYVTGSDFKHNMSALLDRYSAHNAIFPKDAYAIKGFILNKEGKISLVIEQPYVDAKRNATQEEELNYITEEEIRYIPDEITDEEFFEIIGIANFTPEQQTELFNLLNDIENEPEQSIRGNKEGSQETDSPKHEERRAPNEETGRTNAAPKKNSKNEKVLNESDYVEDNLKRHIVENGLDEDEFSESEEFVDVYNNIVDSYPAYIDSLKKSGQLQTLYDNAKLGDKINIRKSIQQAGFEVDEYLDLNKEKEIAKQKREKEKSEKTRQIMENIGIVPKSKKSNDALPDDINLVSLQDIVNEKGEINYGKLKEIADGIEQGTYHINRLSLAESEGEAKGGRRNAETSVILSTDARINKEIYGQLSQKQKVKRQEQILETWAKDTGAWIDYKDATKGKLIERGREATVLESDIKGFVRKVIYPGASSTDILTFLNNKISLRKRIQLVAYNSNIISNFALHLEGECR